MSADSRKPKSPPRSRGATPRKRGNPVRAPHGWEAFARDLAAAKPAPREIAFTPAAPLRQSTRLAGTLGKPHGLKGRVWFYPADDLEGFHDDAELFLVDPAIDPSRQTALRVTVAELGITGDAKPWLAFNEVNERTLADTIARRDVYASERDLMLAEPADLTALTTPNGLDDHDTWASAHVGLRALRQDGSTLGTITAYDPAAGGVGLWIIDAILPSETTDSASPRQLMVPAAQPFVVAHTPATETSPATVTLALPDGLESLDDAKDE